MSKNYTQFLERFETAPPVSERLEAFVDAYHKYHKNISESLDILDIGCGKNVELLKYKVGDDRYHGCDFYDSINVVIEDYKRIDLNNESLATVYNKKFDVIFCGEVIEHVFSPDDLLCEIGSLMSKDSILILSTPNLCYYVNRLLLLVGISPLFLENSSRIKLGRKFKWLGQGNKTEGHIRYFTYGALKDILNLYGFKIIDYRSIISPWKFWPDRIICKLHPSLAADNVIIAKKIQ